MLSLTPLRMIEGQNEAILAPAVEQMRNDPALEYISQLTEAQIREWGSSVLDSLSAWLADRNDPGLAKRFLFLGRSGKSAPLHEILRALHILKRNIVDFMRDQEFCQPGSEVCIEEELGEFFDWAEEHLAHGCERESGQR